MLGLEVCSFIYPTVRHYWQFLMSRYIHCKPSSNVLIPSAVTVGSVPEAAERAASVTFSRQLLLATVFSHTLVKHVKTAEPTVLDCMNICNKRAK